MSAPSAVVLADSVNDAGDRLTTLEVKMHRFVLAEWNTHRQFSRNSASSRAIPILKQIDRVLNDPAMPVEWGKNQAGMQATERITDPDEIEECEKAWLTARDNAVRSVRKLQTISDRGVHKQIANRLLEPWMWHTAIVSATAWQNFFQQRCTEFSPLAQPEMRAAADATRVAILASSPQLLKFGEWHTPLIQPDEYDRPIDERKQVAVARCARVSYLTHAGVRDWSEDLLMYKRLVEARPMHACYDDKTGVLTRDGWKPWPSVTGDEEFLTLDLATDTIEYQHASRLVRERYNGPMVQVQLRSVDALVTPNHRMVAQARERAVARGDAWSPWSLLPAAHLHDRAHRVRLAGGEWRGDLHAPSEAALVGFTAADGHVRDGGIHFHLRRERKIAWLKTRVPDLRCNADDRYAVWGLSEDLATWAKLTYTDSRERCFPRELLERGDAETLRALLYGYLEGDGTPKRRDSYTCVTTSRQLADDIQECAAKAGLAAIETKPVPASPATGQRWAKSRLYRVTVYSPQHSKPRVGWTQPYRREQVTDVDYCGMVYCVTVPNGTLYVRRNGKPMWSGNSPLEHVATPSTWASSQYGNFHGWQQHRYEVEFRAGISSWL